METDTVYRGFGYRQMREGVWRITLPSRIKSEVQAADEDAVKAMIDEIVEGSDGD